MEWYSILGIVCGLALAVCIFKGIQLAKKQKEEEQTKEIKKQEEESLKERVHKSYQESLVIEKENNLATFPINKAFEEKYGITFLQFKKEHERTSVEINLFDDSSNMYTFRKIDTIPYFTLCNTKNKSNFHELLTSLCWDNKAFQIYKNITIDEIEKDMYHYDLLEYVEYIVEEGLSFSSTSQNSKLGLAIHEEIWGTAATVQKVLNSQAPKKATRDTGYLNFYFASPCPSKLHTLSDSLVGVKYLKGAKKKVWEEKNIDRVKNKAAIASSTATASPTPKTKSLEELKDLKELLDLGVITQEEFEQKKKQILGL